MKKLIVNYLAPIGCVMYFVIAFANMAGCQKTKPELLPRPEQDAPEPRIKVKDVVRIARVQDDGVHVKVWIVEVDSVEYIISTSPITKLENETEPDQK